MSAPRFRQERPRTQQAGKPAAATVMSAPRFRQERPRPAAASGASAFVVFAGGGTGGHLVPALATARALKEKACGAECVFLTSRRALESFHGLLGEYRTVIAPEVRWLGVGSALPFAFSSAVSLGRTLDMFRRRRPDVVVGMGGWGCAPAVIAARMMSIPTLLFEANAIPGKAVRMLAALSDTVQLQWEDSAGRLKTARTLPCGTPVRADLFDGDRREACRRYRLDPRCCTMLVMGGTQGALTLNRLLKDAIGLLAAQTTRLQVLHLTGPAHLEEFRALAPPEGIIYRPIGFEAKMQGAYAAADFALCRAGGGTLAELSALGLPAVLMPYPHAADGHQLANAKKMAEVGGAILAEQHKTTPRKLARIISMLVDRKDLRAEMKAAMRSAGHPGAACEVADAVIRLSERRRGGAGGRRPANGESYSALYSLLEVRDNPF